MSNKINAFATKSYRFILGISKFDKMKNIEILKTVDDRELTETIIERQKNFIKKHPSGEG
jgi:hypothetical protein